MQDQAFGIVPIFRQDQELWFLLIQHHEGHWGFPKGHAEDDESAMVAACREFEEETGIRDYQLIDVPSFKEIYSFVKRHKTIEKTVIYFTAVTKTMQVNCQEKEIQDYAWLPFQAAMERLTFPQSKQILTQVVQFLQH